MDTATARRTLIAIAIAAAYVRAGQFAFALGLVALARVISDASERRIAHVIKTFGVLV